MAFAIAAGSAACASSGTATPTPGNGGGTVGSAAPGGSALPGGSSAAGQAGQPSVRIGNFYVDQNLQPGPALDLYDTPVGQAGAPILTAVPHGSFSAYVHPPESAGIVQMYVLPTGEDPVANMSDGKGVGGYQDDGSHLQETLILAGQGSSGSGCLAPGPICELSVSSVVEKGDDANGSTGPVAPPPAAGQAELLVSTQVLDDENLNARIYFFIDASCDPPLNGDASQEPGLPYVFAVSGSSHSVFATMPGTHDISVVADSGSDLPACAALAPKQGHASVEIAAGQQDLVDVYGTSLTDLALAVAPIQP
jgi:hypothetical protein